MAAPKGNEFWKQRSKHGRDKIIQDSDALLESAYEYFQYCVDNPVIEVDYRGKDATPVEIKKAIPFQKSELAVFVGVAKWETISNLKDDSKDFMEVITHIESIIYAQKFKYAAIGAFNSTIMSRELGLVDKSKQEVTQKQPLFPDQEYEDSKKQSTT